jgi:hypothetical protein
MAGIQPLEQQNNTMGEQINGVISIVRSRRWNWQRGFEKVRAGLP